MFSNSEEKRKTTKIAPSTVTRDVELTGEMVEELVLSPEKLSWFHDDGIWELIPDCCLSYRLQGKTIHILYCVCVCVSHASHITEFPGKF